MLLENVTEQEASGERRDIGERKGRREEAEREKKKKKRQAERGIKR